MALTPRQTEQIDHALRGDGVRSDVGTLLGADSEKLATIEAGADVTDAANVNAAGAVMESDYNANTILAATSDNVPAALTVGEATLVGRAAGGSIAALAGATLEGITRTALAASTGAINVNGQNIENVGVIKFADSQYADYLVGGFQLGSGASAPTIRVYRDSIQLPAFAGTGQLEEGFFEIHILHDIKAGSTPTFHVHWSHIIAVPSGNVKWNISLTACKGYRVGTFPAAATLSTVSAATTQYEHVITSDDDMPLPPALVAILEPDMKIIGRIYRDPADAADTFANDAYFLGLDLHYQVGQSGTTERNRPFTSAGFGA